MRRILADRDARLYMGGHCLSTLGDSALWLAAGIWTKTLTGSPAAAGTAFFMFALGGLFGPAGGMLTDRLRRRPLLIGANLGSAVLVLVLMLVHDRDQVWLINAVMLGYGVSAALLAPAETALLQIMLPEDLLGDANSVALTARLGLRLIAPPFGAGLFATLGPKPVILAVAFIFVIAAAVLFALRVPKDRAAPSEGTWVAEMTAGARHIAGTPVLRQVTIAATAAMIAFGMAQMLLFVVVDQGLHQPDAFVAILISAQGAGAIAAGACAAGIARWLGDSILVGLGLSSTALGLLLETLPSIPTALAGAVVVGASSAWIGIGAMTLFQRRTPSELMGRVDAALGLAFFAPQTVAIGVGATLITAVDYRILLLALVATTALAAAYLLSRPGPIMR